MSVRSRTILDYIRDAADEFAPSRIRDGLPSEVFAQFILEDDPYKEQIIRRN